MEFLQWFRFQLAHRQDKIRSGQDTMKSQYKALSFRTWDGKEKLPDPHHIQSIVAFLGWWTQIWILGHQFRPLVHPSKVNEYDQHKCCSTCALGRMQNSRYRIDFWCYLHVQLFNPLRATLSSTWNKYFCLHISFASMATATESFCCRVIGGL